MNKKIIHYSILIIVFALFCTSHCSVDVKAKEIVPTLKKDRIVFYLQGSAKKTKVSAKKMLKNYDANTMTLKAESEDEMVCKIKKNVLYAKGTGATYVQLTVRNKLTLRAVFSKKIRVECKAEKVEKQKTDNKDKPEELYLKYYKQACELYQNNENKEEVIRLYKKAIEYKNDSGIMFNIAYVYMMDGDYHNALEWYLAANDNGDLHAVDNYIYTVVEYVTDSEEAAEYLMELENHLSAMDKKERIAELLEYYGSFEDECNQEYISYEQEDMYEESKIEEYIEEEING